MAIFNSYVSLPEGKFDDVLKFSGADNLLIICHETAPRSSETCDQSRWNPVAVVPNWSPAAKVRQGSVIRQEMATLWLFNELHHFSEG